MACLYCGSTRRFSPINICVCGRSGSWSNRYRPVLIDCPPQHRTPSVVRFVRRMWFSLFPVNGPIIAAARRELAQRDPWDYGV